MDYWNISPELISFVDFLQFQATLQWSSNSSALLHYLSVLMNRFTNYKAKSDKAAKYFFQISLLLSNFDCNQLAEKKAISNNSENKIL